MLDSSGQRARERDRLGRQVAAADERARDAWPAWSKRPLVAGGGYELSNQQAVAKPVPCFVSRSRGGGCGGRHYPTATAAWSCVVAWRPDGRQRSRSRADARRRWGVPHSSSLWLSPRAAPPCSQVWETIIDKAITHPPSSPGVRLLRIDHRPALGASARGVMGAPVHLEVYWPVREAVTRARRAQRGRLAA